MLSKKDIQDFFILENSHAKKELGQNFLINEDVIKEIANSINVNEDEKVLEIGPGLGSLTDELIKKDIKLTVVEYDQKFVNFLNKCYENNSNIKIIKDNILQYKDYSFKKIIGNLPYYITTEVLQYVFLNYKDLKEAVFMVQNEALNRILALYGKDYNALNVLISYRFNIDKLFKVSKESFYPIPNVESIVFKVTIKESADYDFSLSLFKVARILFSLRRKTIYNNLKSVVKDQIRLKEILQRCDLSLTSRSEELKVNDFINLTKTLKEENYIN